MYKTSTSKSATENAINIEHILTEEYHTDDYYNSSDLFTDIEEDLQNGLNIHITNDSTYCEGCNETVDKSNCYIDEFNNKDYSSCYSCYDFIKEKYEKQPEPEPKFDTEGIPIKDVNWEGIDKVLNTDGWTYTTQEPDEDKISNFSTIYILSQKDESKVYGDDTDNDDEQCKDCIVEAKKECDSCGGYGDDNDDEQYDMLDVKVLGFKTTERLNGDWNSLLFEIRNHEYEEKKEKEWTPVYGYFDKDGTIKQTNTKQPYGVFCKVGEDCDYENCSCGGEVEEEEEISSGIIYDCNGCGKTTPDDNMWNLSGTSNEATEARTECLDCYKEDSNEMNWEISVNLKEGEELEDPPVMDCDNQCGNLLTIGTSIMCYTDPKGIDYTMCRECYYDCSYYQDDINPDNEEEISEFRCDLNECVEEKPAIVSNKKFDTDALDNALNKDDVDWTFEKPKKEGTYSIVYIIDQPEEDTDEDYRGMPMICDAMDCSKPTYRDEQGDNWRFDYMVYCADCRKDF